jgi:homoserine kinase
MSITVRVPASTSNLGAGFDCVGVAVDRWLRLDAELSRDRSAGVSIQREGTLAAVRCEPERDHLYTGFVATCARAGHGVPRSVVFRAASEIPVGRGLGSSAAAFVAGAAAANALLGLGLGDDALIAICSDLEGHPDNVAPAVRGGAVLALIAQGGEYHAAPLHVHPSLRLVFAVPDFEVDTKYARAALPDAVPFTDAQRAAAASAALVQGLAHADPVLLAAGLEGPLHIPYRRPLVRGYDDVLSAARAAGAVGATLSGSGSAIVAIAPLDVAPTVALAMGASWRSLGVRATSFISAPAERGYITSRRDDARTAPPSSNTGVHISKDEVQT